VAEAIRDCPNAFLDLSFVLPRYRGSSLWSDFSHLLNTFDRRIVFGSDFPEVGIGEALICFRDAANAASPEKRDRVLGLNLSAILFGEE
jgi:predicted TIM-barrel fold metal-dependent hydrolase